MAILGTFVNGKVEWDEPPKLEDGTRVELHPIEDEDDSPIPPEMETYEEHLAKLRQSIADSQAGIGLMSLADFTKEMERDFGLSPRSES